MRYFEFAREVIERVLPPAPPQDKIPELKESSPCHFEITQRLQEVHEDIYFSPAVRVPMHWLQPPAGCERSISNSERSSELLFACMHEGFFQEIHRRYTLNQSAYVLSVRLRCLSSRTSRRVRSTSPTTSRQHPPVRESLGPCPLVG